MSSTHAEALSELRLQLLSNGYEPIPIARHDASGASPGKRPTLAAWRTVEITPDAIRDWQSSLASSRNTGIRTGRLVGVDFDVLDRGLAAELDELAASMLGTTPLVRIGKDPKALWCFQADEPFGKIETPELILPDGTKAQIEILADGQQFVSHGIHPDTRRPYRWVQGSPENTRLEDLPIITKAAAEAFVKAAEAVLREAGGRTEKEINPPQKPERPKSEGVKTEAKAGGDFFRQVNNAALADIGPWLRQIFPGAEWLTNSARPPGMWRVSSKDIGRDLEEDLSVHPELGAQDFGTRESLTPIDIMMRHGGAPDAKSAAFAICDALRIDPASLGWGQKKEREPISGPNEAERSARSPEQAANDVPEQDLFPLTWFEDIHPVADAKDFVQGVLIEQSAAVVYGESNAGKTFWTTDLALHVAAGKEWCGRRIEGGPVIYCALEGGVGFQNRVSAWRAKHGMEDAVIPFAALQVSLNLLKPEADTPRLIATLRRVAEQRGQPKLIVIDTLSRAMAGGNENAPDDMGALVRNMDAIKQAIGCCVLFIHHSGKDAAKGARGHSLLRAAIDTEIEVKAEEGSNLKTATVVKQRELKKGDVFGFTLDIIQVGQNRHGEDVTTCVIEPTSTDTPDMSGPRNRVRSLSGDTRIAFEVLQSLMAERGASDFRGAPEGVLSVPADWWRERFYDRGKAGASADAKQKAFTRAVTNLTEKHAIGAGNGRVWIAW